jgi:hypothetical protein
MILSNDEMDRVLDDFEDVMASDEEIVSVAIEPGGEEQTPRIVIWHLNPDRAGLLGSIASQYELQRSSAEALTLAVVVERSGPIDPELGRPDDPSLFEGASVAAGMVGRAGTKISRPNGSWGTVGLSGSAVRAAFGSKVCQLSTPFIVTNSHVVNALGTMMTNGGVQVGKAHCLFDLDQKPSFDYGQIEWSQNVDKANFFRVYEANNSAGKRLAGLRVATLNAAVGKQGAKTGWTTGKVTARAIITLTGHKGTFRCWRATYASAPGDSGSPVLQQVNGAWYSVGIHFAGGAHFAGWDVIGPGAGKKEFAIEAKP